MIVAVTEGAVTTGTPPTIGRVFKSSLGPSGSWSELTPSPVLTDPTSFFFGRIGNHYGVMLWGQNGPQPGGAFTYSDPFVIGRSEDYGQTWANCVAHATFPDLTMAFFGVADFVSFSPLIVLALGEFTTDGFSTNFGILRSDDGGHTFVRSSPPSLSDGSFDTGISFGNGVGLISRQQNAGAPLVWKTTDAGSSWTAVTLPDSGANSSRITSFLRMSSGRVVAVGDMNLPTGFRNPVVWYSDDPALASWSVNTTPVPGLSVSDYWHVTDSAVAVGDQAILGMVQEGVFGGPTPDVNFKPYRLTTDGITWSTPGTYSTTLSAALQGHTEQMSVSDDGTVLAVQATRGGDLAGVNGVAFTVWRGTVTAGAVAWTVAYQPLGTADDFACRHAWLMNVAQVQVVPTPNPGGGSPCLGTVRTRLGDCIDTLTDDDIIRGSWQAGDRLIINRLIFSIDWDYLTQQFTKHVIYTFDDSVRKYGLRPAMRIESKGIRSMPTACGSVTVGCGISQLDERAFNLGARYADPPPMLNLEIFYRKHTWEPGDIICVTSAFVPNVVAGRRGIVDEAFEIINIQQNFAPEGKIILTLLDVEAITLPADPSVTDPGEEQQLIQRERTLAVGTVELPRRLAEGRHLRHEVARWQRGPQQEPPPIIPAPSPRREVLAGSGGRGLAPTVP